MSDWLLLSLIRWARRANRETLTGWSIRMAWTDSGVTVVGRHRISIWLRVNVLPRFYSLDGPNRDQTAMRLANTGSLSQHPILERSPRVAEPNILLSLSKSIQHFMCESFLLFHLNVCAFFYFPSFFSLFSLPKLIPNQNRIKFPQ